jgi:DNA (cytosine-5)-methyltransferase 1
MRISDKYENFRGGNVDYTEKMWGIDLFTGIGGLTLSLSDWIRPAIYCEIDRYAQSVLLSRMASGQLPIAPIWDDIKTLDVREFRGHIDIIYGGFPCQDISIAGAGRGLEGERSGLFFEILRLADEIKPKFIFLENVPAISTRGLDRVAREISALGYDCRWDIVSAAEVGALHKRERWFLLGYAKHNGSFACETRGSPGEEFIQREQLKQAETVRESQGASDLSPDVAYSNCPGLQEKRAEQQTARTQQCLPMANSDSKSGPRLRSREEERFPIVGVRGKYSTIDQWQKAVSSMDRVTDGIPHRAHRIKCLGNGVVPIQAKEAFERLIGIKV